MSRVAAGRILYVLLLIGFVASYVGLHGLADYRFPIPWPDEGSFLWQAIAFQKTNSLLAPQLNPDRHILWMPPGYMLVTGLLFKLFGFSFDIARALSCIFMMGSFLLILGMARRLGVPLLSLLVVGAFLLSRHFVFAGNVARMEGLLVLTVIAGFLLLARGHHVQGLTLLALSPLVHPNGLAFILGGFVYCVVEWYRQRRLPRWSLGAAASIVIALLAWLAYVVYVGLHWEAFQSDMAFQMAFKGLIRGGQDAVLDRLLTPSNVITLALAGLCLLYGYRKWGEVLAITWFALSSKAVVVATRGWGYDIYDSLFFLLQTVALLGVVCHAWSEHRLDRAWLPGWALPTLLLAVGLFWNIHHGYVESPVGYPWQMSLHGMQLSKDVPYMVDSEEEAIRSLLRSLNGDGSPVEVQFYPAADALFFQDLEGPGLRFAQPTFHERRADVHIAHRSRYIPEILAYFADVQLDRAGYPPPSVEKFRVLHERDGTEKWLWQVND